MTDPVDDDIWKSLEELHREGMIEHIPTIGSAEEQTFTMTDEGKEWIEEKMRNSDEHVLFMCKLAVQDVDRQGDPGNIARALIRIATFLKDEVGVNAFRVLKRNAEYAPGLDVEDLDEEFVRQFDPVEDE